MTLIPANMQPYNRWLLLGMLALLHLALWLGVDNPFTRPLLFAHLGLFLLWQPLWRGELELRTGSILTIFFASIIALWFLNWWLLAFWLSGLFALIGGRVFASYTRWVRLRLMVIMTYLLMVLLFWVVPHLFAPQALTDTTRGIMAWALPVILASTALFPNDAATAETGRTVDFVYSLLLFLLLVLLVLGDLSFMTIEKADYLDALLRTLFSIALMLFALAWLWSPRFGFGGLRSMFSRYLLNVGTPFETWLRQMAEIAQSEPDPSSFLAQATVQLAALPWLSGISWQTDTGSGSLGSTSPHYATIHEKDLNLTLYSRQNISPSMELHIRLLGQLLADFHQAKQREQRLREMAQLQATYETGARLTHDLKNMLQSLSGLISVAQQDPAVSAPALQRQLPALAQRIELALSKLKTPQPESSTAMLPLASWWEAMRRRHAHDELVWEYDNHSKPVLVPASLFDSVADNLISNALDKRQRISGLNIRVALLSKPLRLTVCDDGDGIPAHLADQLLHTVVPSENGLGIGLYQASRWARQLGYKLSLCNNTNGQVCFELVSDRSIIMQ